MRRFRFRMCARKPSAKADELCRCLINSSRVITNIAAGVIVVAVATRFGCPARQLSPTKSPESRIATTASLPLDDRTDNRTRPRSMYMRVVAASPCENTVVHGACSTRSAFTVAQLMLPDTSRACVFRPTNGSLERPPQRSFGKHSSASGTGRGTQAQRSRDSAPSRMRVMLHRTPNGRNAGPRHHVTLSHVPEQLSDRMMRRPRSVGLEMCRGGLSSGKSRDEGFPFTDVRSNVANHSL